MGVVDVVGLQRKGSSKCNGIHHQCHLNYTVDTFFGYVQYFANGPFQLADGGYTYGIL